VCGAAFIAVVLAAFAIHTWMVALGTRMSTATMGTVMGSAMLMTAVGTGTCAWIGRILARTGPLALASSTVVREGGVRVNAP